MDDYVIAAAPVEQAGMKPVQLPAFEFHGSWKEFLPIAATNLLLSLVTLGIYRFWAKTRTRKYLWSKTRFIDERLEWAGTGREMFIGFLIAMAILLPLILFMQFGVQALILRGETVIAGIAALIAYIMLFYLVGVAMFRALRYRLSRTYWHGIRGGSDDNGWAYAFSATWRYIAGILTLGLLIPWVMSSLWRKRWSAMSFGPYRFEHEKTGISDLFLAFLVAVLAPILAIAIAAGVLFSSPASLMGNIVSLLLLVVGGYLIFILASVVYSAMYLRKMIGEMRLSTLEFNFTAHTLDWIALFIGNLVLVILTLGLGLGFIPYRNWSFFIRHMEADGEIKLDTLTQSTSSRRSDAEGLADAFDLGAM